MLNVTSPPRLALLPSPSSGSDALKGAVHIPSLPVDPRFLDSYDEMDRQAGLALFDPAFAREALAALRAELAREEPPVHAPTGGVAALAS